jgi:hypothetical protein
MVVDNESPPGAWARELAARGTWAPRAPLFIDCDVLLVNAATLLAPYPFCYHPDKCIPTGRCMRETCCAD